jgi:hypothetical protein
VRPRPANGYWTVALNLTTCAPSPVAAAWITTGWTAGVQFLAGARDFSLLHVVQTGSGTHPASSPMGNCGSVPGGNAAEA